MQKSDLCRSAVGAGDASSPIGIHSTEREIAVSNRVSHGARLKSDDVLQSIYARQPRVYL